MIALLSHLMLKIILKEKSFYFHFADEKIATRSHSKEVKDWDFEN
jgi:hypothetical protein